MKLRFFSFFARFILFIEAFELSFGTSGSEDIHSYAPVAQTVEIEPQKVEAQKVARQAQIEEDRIMAEEIARTMNEDAAADLTPNTTRAKRNATQRGVSLDITRERPADLSVSSIKKALAASKNSSDDAEDKTLSQIAKKRKLTSEAKKSSDPGTSTRESPPTVITIGPTTIQPATSTHSLTPRRLSAGVKTESMANSMISIFGGKLNPQPSSSSQAVKMERDDEEIVDLSRMSDDDEPLDEIIAPKPGPSKKK